ncbi:MAG: S1 RNA-binding domain-containing protein [Syntrophomonadaceae bacterium]|jgi:S1 RNA binding domain protein
MPTEQTNIVPGSIVDGKVQGITNFGAFVELPGGVVGLVHISEIADTYVKDVKDFIQEGQTVKVKVLSVAGKKIGLSIKQALPKREETKAKTVDAASPYHSNRTIGKSNPRGSGGTPSNSPSLDDKIAKFLKESDERMQQLKNKLEPKKRHRGN